MCRRLSHSPDIRQLGLRAVAGGGGRRAPGSAEFRAYARKLDASRPPDYPRAIVKAVKTLQEARSGQLPDL